MKANVKSFIPCDLPGPRFPHYSGDHEDERTTRRLGFSRDIYHNQRGREKAAQDRNDALTGGAAFEALKIPRLGEKKAHTCAC